MEKQRHDKHSLRVACYIDCLSWSEQKLEVIAVIMPVNAQQFSACYLRSKPIWVASGPRSTRVVHRSHDYSGRPRSTRSYSVRSSYLCQVTTTVVTVWKRVDMKNQSQAQTKRIFSRHWQTLLASVYLSAYQCSRFLRPRAANDLAGWRDALKSRYRSRYRSSTNSISRRRWNSSSTNVGDPLTVCFL